MSRARELLRKAAEEFADRIYELLRTELVDELRRELVAEAALQAASTPALPTATEPPRPKRASSADRIVAFVVDHPGTGPKDVIAALKINRKTVFDALSDGCERGVLRKEGMGRSVAYFAGDASREAAPAPEPAKKRAKAPTDIDERVVAFIVDHPGCRYGEIAAAIRTSEGILHRAMSTAKARGAIRMEGTRIKARYFPADSSAEPIKIELPPPPRVPSVRPPKVASLPPPPLQEASVAPARAKATSAADRATVVRLLDELDEAAAEDIHPLRLGVLLQAIIAEIREVKPRVSPNDPLMGELDHAIRRIGGIRKDKSLPFITGLKRDAEEDWVGIAKRARARLAAFDRDAEETPRRRSKRPPPQPPRAERVVREVANDVAPFPALRAFARERPLVLVGGIKKNEVLEQIENRYQIRADWAAAQGANARALDAFVDRVRHGRIGAVVVLEGLFGTTQVQTVVGALKTAEVPFAYGDRAGTESLRRALAELDRAVGSAS